MTRRLSLAFAVVALFAGGWPVAAQLDDQALARLLGSAAAYVRGYEERFSVLVAEERYVQEIRRPDNNPVAGKTTRGRALPASGRMWIEAATGVVLKTTMTAADPLVRALSTTTYRRDAALDRWVPARMEDYYKADSEVDEVSGIAAYSNYRTFTVATERFAARRRSKL
jgi:hypothetical protein